MLKEKPNAYDASGRYLATQARTRKQLEEYLFKKGYDRDEIDSAVERLSQYKWLDDNAYTAEYIRSRDANAPLSRRALLDELHRRGVDKDVSEAAVEGISDEQEYAKAKSIAERIARTCKDTDRKLRSKQFRALASRGFEYSLISEVLGEEYGHQE